MKVLLLELKISLGNYRDVVGKLVQLGQSRQTSYVCVANVHMLVEGNQDTNFASLVNLADMVTPDGMPLVWGIKLLYGINQDRVAGMDLLPELLRASENEELTVFFYGGTESMLQLTDQYLATHFPGLEKKHFFSPPFRPLTEIEEEEIVHQINSSGANFVFVALGCPKQEKWMASMKGRIHACMIGIGGALPVMIGMQKRAPKWMQKTGLEWLYRLLQEPQRLFKRYAVTNSMFIWLLLKAWAKQGFRSRPISV
jgi:N-acetylglucosaminyldiphosphoundecaprenol N-acetyl-beta-D-mannosaminyltransferase